MSEISQIVSSLESVVGGGRLLIDLPAAVSGDLNADLELEGGSTRNPCPLKHCVRGW